MNDGSPSETSYEDLEERGERKQGDDDSDQIVSDKGELQTENLLPHKIAARLAQLSGMKVSDGQMFAFVNYGIVIV